MQINDKGVLDIYHGVASKRARGVLPPELHAGAARLLDRLNAAASPNDLRIPASNRLELLKGDRKGQWSIRINDQYRICFKWVDGEAVNVEITDYH